MNTRKAGGRLLMADARDRSAVLAEYTKWLVEYRNASEVSIHKHRRYLAFFFEWLSHGRSVNALSGLSHDQVEAFFLRYSSTRGAASREQMQAVLRVFLRFCFAKGHTRDLSGAVPTLRSFRLATVPRAVSQEDIHRILTHINRATPIGRRDYAMIQMFHEYGVRSKQVRMLRLCDVDWKRSEVRFPIMKYGKDVCMPLTSLVGESLCDYLQHGRPPSLRQEVFLSARPPFKALRHASMITAIVLRHAIAAGITSHTVGPHQFRHAFATRMLNEGQSLKAIADLLGHRRLQTTFIYTKVDFQSLSAVPLEWPEDRP
jgi:integrase/recombinase XerD